MIGAVLDVNVVVSAVIGPLGHSRRVAEALRAGRFAGFTSQAIAAEVEVKLRPPRISRRYHIAEADVRWARDLLDEAVELVVLAPEDVLHVTGDPEDDGILATARLAGADYVVTGDRGLLALGRYEGAEIVTPRRFLEILGETT